ADVAPPGERSRGDLVRLRRDDRAGGWFPWASVSASDVGRVARAAGFPTATCRQVGDRWLARLA
ncbi:MAG: SAM-dependent methyltransferase, partial [Nonomuraea sp.]|nr:SAM-dependent methyltransferase [Nonomuraea sp.]